MQIVSNGGSGAAEKTLDIATYAATVTVNFTSIADSGLSKTITTTRANQVVDLSVSVACRITSATASGTLYVNYQYDGATDIELGYPPKGQFVQNSDGYIQFHRKVTVATPGTYTFKIRWFTDVGATFSVYGTNVVPLPAGTYMSLYY